MLQVSATRKQYTPQIYAWKNNTEFPRYAYLWQLNVWSAVLIFRMSNNLTVLSVDPVATTHSLKGLKAKQLT
jgi:hypothetical protein